MVFFSWNAVSSVEKLRLIVDPLTLKEDYWVGSRQSRVHQAFGVVGSGRKDDLQARDMGAEGSPILGVLGTVLGADGNAQDNGHLQQAPTHRLPFRKLIEDFVSGPA